MFETLFQQSESPQLLVDRQSGEILLSNGAFDRTFGPVRTEPAWWLHFESESEQAVQILRELFEQDTQEQVRLRDVDRRPQHYLVSSELLDIDSRRVAHIVFRNVEDLVSRQELLEHAMKGTGAGIGRQFFEQALRTLITALKMDIAFIARRSKDGASAEMVCFIMEDRVVPNLTYPIEDTPCWSVYAESRIHCIPNGVQDEYPRDRDLQDLCAKSYVGIPIIEAGGEVVAHIALLHTGAIAEPSEAEKLVLRIVAARTEAELHRMEIEHALMTAKSQAELANESKTRLLANVSHELRSPMNAILGFAQLMELEPGLNEEHRGMLASILRNGESLKTLLTDILEVAQIELGQFQRKQTDVDVLALLTDICASFRPPADAKHIQLRLVADNEIPLTRMPGDRVRQIVSNLVDNAIKFTPYHGIVTISAEPDPASDSIRIVVADTGPGIPSETIEGIFRPFDRGKTETVPGSGLGLAISRSLANALGFELRVSSQTGDGSSFSLTLPITRVARPVESFPPRASREETRIGGLVLVVDDHQPSREVLRRFLEIHGFGVEHASDGVLAVERCCHVPVPDVIIMDIRMPRMNGIEATARIRHELSDHCPPILAVTGNLIDATGARFDTSCFDGVLAKPFELDELLQYVRQLLSDSESSMKTVSPTSD